MKKSLNQSTNFKNVLYGMCDFETTAAPADFDPKLKNGNPEVFLASITFALYDLKNINQSFNPQPSVVKNKVSYLFIDEKLNKYRYNSWLDLKTNHNLQQVSEKCRLSFEFLNLTDWLMFILFCGKVKLQLYFHNAAKFDNHFILNPELFRKMGIEKYIPRESCKKQGIYYDFLNVKGSQIYEIRFLFYFLKETEKNGVIGEEIKRTRSISIADSAKLFQSSIEKMGVNVSKHFDIDLTKQGTTQQRKMLYSRKKLFSSFSEYLKHLKGFTSEYFVNDTLIMSYFFEMLLELKLPIGLEGKNRKLKMSDFKLTVGATSFSIWEKFLGEKLLQMGVKRGFFKVKKYEKGFKKYSYRKIKDGEDIFVGYDAARVWCLKNFVYKNNEWLQFQKDEFGSWWKYFKQWYIGGKFWVNEDFRGVLVAPKKPENWKYEYQKGQVFIGDYKSSYPSIMVSKTHFFGVGEPWQKLNPDTPAPPSYNFHLYKIRIKKTMNPKANITSFIPEKTGTSLSWVKTLKAGKEYPMGHYTFLKFKEYYGSDFEIIEKWDFKSITFFNYYGDFIKYFYDLKENSGVAEKLFSKYMINTRYGKDGSNEMNIVFDFNELEDEFEPVDFDFDLKSKYNILAAMTITELGRLHLLSTIGNRDFDVIGGATDSIFIKAPVKSDFDINNWIPEFDKHNRIGGLEIENKCKHPNSFIMKRAGNYILKCDFCKKDSVKKAAMVGFNLNAEPSNILESELKQNLIVKQQLKYSDFIEGVSIPNQLTTYRLTGKGIYLIPIIKTSPSIWEYKKSVEQYKYLKK